MIEPWVFIAICCAAAFFFGIGMGLLGYAKGHADGHEAGRQEGAHEAQRMMDEAFLAEQVRHRRMQVEGVKWLPEDRSRLPQISPPRDQINKGGPCGA